MAAGDLPFAAVLLATAVVALHAATSAVPVAATAADKYSGRMVIIRVPAGATVVSAGGALNKWHQQRRLVEDEVAPEFGDAHLLGDDGLNREGQYPDRPWCPEKPCAGRGGRYTRGCDRAYGCPPGPNAGHASRAVHV